MPNYLNTMIMVGFLALNLLSGPATNALGKPVDIFAYAFKISQDLVIDLDALYGPNPVTLTELKAMTSASDSYDDFLKRLHGRAPDLFDNFVLLHKSGSIQAASPERPRVILFGDGLLLSFSEPKDSTTRHVEILAFDRDSFRFNATEIRFADSSEPKFEESPLVCTSCHGSDVRPIWEPYDFWPDAYGSGIARMTSTEESTAYKTFFNQRRPSGIYQYLEDYADARDHNKLESVEAFTVYISNLNFLRVGKLMSAEKSRLEPFKYAMYASLSRCSDGSRHSSTMKFSDFFPPESFAHHEREYESLLSETTGMRSYFKTYLEKRYAINFPGFTRWYYMDQNRLQLEAIVAAQLRFIFSRAGLNFEGFAMSSGVNKYSFSTPSNFGFDWLTALAVFDRQDMVTAGAAGSTGFLVIPCETLKKLSINALENHEFKQHSALKNIAQATPISKCVSCHHQEEGSIPHLPFDDNKRMVELFSKRPGFAQQVSRRLRATDRTRMPPDGSLGEQEIAAIEQAMLRIQGLSH